LKLPPRIALEVPREPAIFVDGTARGLGARGGLELSHWPGHTTPLALRDDLSTGCALKFARLTSGNRRRLAGAATAIVNNHYDTDGCLAMFAVRHPDRALPLAARMLAAARAGDLYRAPDDDAFALDALINGLSDRERSPLRDDLRAADDAARWQLCVDHLMEALPALLAGDVKEYRDLWEPDLERYRQDRAVLAAADREDVPALDLSIWTAGTLDLMPGRHALFGTSARDRALTIESTGDGARVRLVVSTSSWFDLVTETRLPRPDLLPLAAHLNALEGTTDADAHAWRAQPLGNASPELWFGSAELPFFAEHNEALFPTRLAPARVRAEILSTLR